MSDRTLAQLQSLRTDVIEPQLAEHARRLFKAMGDGFLIEFAGAVQAVSCATAIKELEELRKEATTYKPYPIRKIRCSDL